jgi:acetate---CoA ligase (ADP-forming)
MSAIEEQRANQPRIDLDAFFRPKSVAFIGASEAAVSGHMTYANTQLQQHNYPGHIYPINPNRETVWGLKAYPRIADAPTVPEFAMMAINQQRVLGAVKECAAAGVKAILVDVLGYADQPGSRGHEMQDELAAFVRQSGLLMVGPNTLGLANYAEGIPFLAGYTHKMHPWPGKLAIISQSGGNTLWLLEAAYDRHIGISFAVNTGNEATLTNCDFLEYLIEEPTVGCVAMYIESIQQPERFLTVAGRAAELNKPIVAIKIGKTETGAAGARAHTGSFSGPDEFADALFARAGVIRALDLDDAMDKCALFCQLPPELWPQGGRVATFVVGGGIAGLSGDLLPHYGLELPPLPAAVVSELSDNAPFNVTVKNPIDLMARFAGARDPHDTSTVASRGQYAQEHAGLGTKLTETFVGGSLADPNFDVALVSSQTPDPTDSSQFLAKLEDLVSETGKPVVFAQPTITTITEAWHEFAGHSKLAVITGVGRAAIGLQAAAEYHERRPLALSPAPARVTTPLTDDLRSAVLAEIESGKKVASHELTFRLLEAYGLPLVQEAVVADPQSATAFADKVGYPVVVKLAKSGAMTHATDVDGVRTNLRDRSEVAKAAEELTSRPEAQDGVVVQQMVRGATEIYFGGANPGYGYPPAVLVGLGGIFVEVARDVAMSLAPVSADDAQRMIERLRMHKILTGFRGRRPVDIASIVNAITRLSDLVLDLKPFFQELDINPALVLDEGEGMRIVDALLIYKKDDDVSTA